jgi:hypothetical protein
LFGLRHNLPDARLCVGLAEPGARCDNLGNIRSIRCRHLAALAQGRRQQAAEFGPRRDAIIG